MTGYHFIAIGSANIKSLTIPNIGKNRSLVPLQEMGAIFKDIDKKHILCPNEAVLHCVEKESFTRIFICAHCL
jgi:hypothetical protein